MHDGIAKHFSYPCHEHGYCIVHMKMARLLKESSEMPTLVATRGMYPSLRIIDLQVQTSKQPCRVSQLLQPETTHCSWGGSYSIPYALQGHIYLNEKQLHIVSQRL